MFDLIVYKTVLTEKIRTARAQVIDNTFIIFGTFINTEQKHDNRFFWQIHKCGLLLMKQHHLVIFFLCRCSLFFLTCVA
uniref:Uncharacterized protein n=1 Tax=Lepeophtheirus salmonis TaxID=72036 RepID=A0A0K2TXI3_LEPSM